MACSSAHESSAQPSPAPQGSGGINRAEHRQKPSLLVVSFDGFRADYLDRFDLPNFRRVMTRGTRAQGMRPAFPRSPSPTTIRWSRGSTRSITASSKTRSTIPSARRRSRFAISRRSPTGRGSGVSPSGSRRNVRAWSRPVSSGRVPRRTSREPVRPTGTGTTAACRTSSGSRPCSAGFVCPPTAVPTSSRSISATSTRPRTRRQSVGPTWPPPSWRSTGRWACCSTASTAWKTATASC